MKALYQILTDLTVIFHLLFIFFVIGGGFLAKGKHWLTIVHLTTVAWAVFAELSPGVICPLTALENYFGGLAGLASYEEDFVTRYLIPIIYQEDLTPTIQYVLAGFVIFINVIAYKVSWKRKSKSSEC